MNYKKIAGLIFNSHGHYKITILFRNQMYSAITTDMPNVDLYKSGVRGYKTAGNSLYNEVVRKLNLK